MRQADLSSSNVSTPLPPISPASYIDTDEATIRADLVQSRVNLEASLRGILGRTAAAQIAEAFVEAVIEYRQRLRRSK
jgi:hypothetical protein